MYENAKDWEIESPLPPKDIIIPWPWQKAEEEFLRRAVAFGLE